MPSEPGSPEPQSEFTADMVREAMEKMREYHYSPERRNAAQFHDPIVSTAVALTIEEQERIAEGEPYCYRCGKPASSFEEYKIGAEDEGLPGPVPYVIREEGTYNNDTNRFACDACYIAIGMPAGEPGDAYGWKAP